jgi:hypothetical protein
MTDRPMTVAGDGAKLLISDTVLANAIADGHHFPNELAGYTPMRTFPSDDRIKEWNQNAAGRLILV